jgi:hypothetical protein
MILTLYPKSKTWREELRQNLPIEIYPYAIQTHVKMAVNAKSWILVDSSAIALSRTAVPFVPIWKKLKVNHNCLTIMDGLSSHP